MRQTVQNKGVHKGVLLGGLVLAVLTLSAYPRVKLPILLYNLVQHLGAGSVQFLLFRKHASEYCCKFRARQRRFCHTVIHDCLG